MIHHVAREGEVIGEFSPAEFRKRVANGTILASDYYWREDMPDWQRVSDWHPPAVAPTVRMLAIPATSGPVAVVKKAPPALDKRARICLQCGYVGRPNKVTAGSSRTEMLLWLCLFLPGMIYTVWRLTTRKQVCPECSTPNMVPTTSAAAQNFFTGSA